MCNNTSSKYSISDKKNVDKVNKYEITIEKLSKNSKINNRTKHDPNKMCLKCKIKICFYNVL